MITVGQATNKKSKLQQFLYKYYYVLILIIIVVTVLNLVYKVGVEPIKDWDEARHGVNAYEMIKNNNFIVNTYNYANDYYNLKPPLSYWGIILGFKLFGYNLLGFRFSSILSALLTVILVAVFSYKKFGRTASLVAAGVIATSQQFFIFHGARSGDADSIYVFFFTLAIIAAINSYHKRSYIYITGLAFSFAFLAKSWHTMAIIGVVGLYLLVSKLILKFNIKEWLIFIACSFGPILLWALVRMKYDGFKFIHDMISYDLLSRTDTALEGHTGPMYYYLAAIFINYRMYMAVGVIILLCIFLSRNIKHIITDNYNEKIGILIWILLPLILFSVAKTKLSWYIMPIYPPLAIAAGFLTEYAIENLRNKIISLVLFIMVVAAGGYYELNILKYIHSQGPEALQSYLKDSKSVIEDNDAYVYMPSQFDGPDWHQRTVLALELYKDGRAHDGGVAGFLKSSNNSVLFLDNSKESNKIIEDNNLKVLESNEKVITAAKK